MSKTMIDKDGKEYSIQENKPWYKRVYVWIIVVILLMIIGASNSSSHSKTHHIKNTEVSDNNISSKNKDTQVNRSPIQNNTPTTQHHTNYSVGQLVKTNGLSFKVNKLSYYAGNEFETPKTGNQYVIANVTLINNSHASQDYNSLDFNLDSNGNSTSFNEILTDDNYSNNTLDSGSLDKGATVTGNLLGQAKIGSKLKLIYKPDSLSDRTFKVNLN